MLLAEVPVIDFWQVHQQHGVYHQSLEFSQCGPQRTFAGTSVIELVRYHIPLIRTMPALQLASGAFAATTAA